MDYKILVRKKIIYYLSIGLIIYSLILFSCNDNTGRPDVFYIELINFEDSLNTELTNSISGKVAFYKNDQAEIISKNFLTEKYQNMYYLDILNKNYKKLKQGDIKIRVEEIDNYYTDSVKYLLQKFRYNNGVWNKISDMGVLKATITREYMKGSVDDQYKKQIMRNIKDYIFH